LPLAKRAGLSSTGLISYHFASKADLIGEVVTTVLADLGAFMAVQMEAAGDATAALRACIVGLVPEEQLDEDERGDDAADAVDEAVAAQDRGAVARLA